MDYENRSRLIENFLSIYQLTVQVYFPSPLVNSQVQGKFYSLGAKIELLIKTDLDSRYMLGQGVTRLSASRSLYFYYRLNGKLNTSTLLSEAS